MRVQKSFKMNCQISLLAEYNDDDSFPTMSWEVICQNQEMQKNIQQEMQGVLQTSYLKEILEGVEEDDDDIEEALGEYEIEFSKKIAEICVRYHFTFDNCRIQRFDEGSCGLIKRAWTTTLKLLV